MAEAVARAIKRVRVLQRDGLQRHHGDDGAGVGFGGVDAISFLAHRHRLAAYQRVAVVIFHLAPRTAVDDRLIAVPARAFLALHRAHGDRAELDSLHRPPRLRVALYDLDPVKAGLLECGEERALFHRAGYASAPQLGVVAQMGRHRLIADDI